MHNKNYKIIHTILPTFAAFLLPFLYMVYFLISSDLKKPDGTSDDALIRSLPIALGFSCIIFVILLVVYYATAIKLLSTNIQSIKLGLIVGAIVSLPIPLILFFMATSVNSGNQSVSILVAIEFIMSIFMFLYCSFITGAYVQLRLIKHA